MLEWYDYPVIGLILLFLLGSYFGVYKLGRHLERKELTAALVASITVTYNDGAKDGYNKGYKAGLSSCDDLVNSLNSQGRR